MSRDLWALAAELRRDTRFTDLTHAFFPGQPRFSGDPDGRVERISTAEATGFNIDSYTMVGQWGTHVDAPAHSRSGGRTVDRIPVTEMLAPLVVLDFSAAAAADADFCPTLEDLAAWERHHRRIPAGAFVALRTDWSHRWPDAEAMRNVDAAGVQRTPGWHPAVLDWLIEQRQITAIGHETFDTDPGRLVHAGQFPAQHRLLNRGRWQIELLTNLDRVPETGAMVFAGWPKPRAGTGFPARVVAISD